MEEPWYSMSKEEQDKMNQLSEDLYIAKEGICYISWAGQPDLQFLCDNSWSTPCWGGKAHRSGKDGKEVYLADNKRYYTFDKETTTCPKCKEKLK